MIIGFLDSLSSNKYLSGTGYTGRIIKLIENTDFTKKDDGVYKTDTEDFYYILSTYNTSASIEEKPAEAHRKYIDLQYILYGEEKIGYADYRNPKMSLKEYDGGNDVELFSRIEDESFFILKKDMYCIFFPEDIHRPGLTNRETRSIRKIIFKIAI
ncbi:MAG: YhcH/YjgK/YiaL family protein [Actinomycetia bacterium]|nr:YhcH/YjgK/YiaL family protein [Actinomycetes bacterium]